MSARRRGPGELPHDGEPATPRPAAGIALLRRGGKHGDRALEVLMLKRTEAASFMPGLWVFPGGSVDPGDGEGEAGHRICAVRELAEETGIALPADGGAGPVLALDHPGADPDPVRRLVLPRPRPRPHPARARRGRGRRRRLAATSGGAERTPGGGAAARLPDRPPARVARPLRDLGRGARRLSGPQGRLGAAEDRRGPRGRQRLAAAPARRPRLRRGLSRRRRRVRERFQAGVPGTGRVGVDPALVHLRLQPLEQFAGVLKRRLQLRLAALAAGARGTRAGGR